VAAGPTRCQVDALPVHGVLDHGVETGASGPAVTSGDMTGHARSTSSSTFTKIGKRIQKPHRSIDTGPARSVTRRLPVS